MCGSRKSALSRPPSTRPSALTGSGGGNSVGRGDRPAHGETMMETITGAPADRTLASIEVQEDPYDYYDVLRDQAPVYYDPQLRVYIVSRYDLLMDAIRRTDVFSSIGSQAPAEMRAPPPEVKEIEKQGWPRVNTMVTNDPPSHTRYRKLVDYAFTPKRVKAMKPDMDDIVNLLIDRFIDRGEVELVSEFAVPVPLYVIADQLGVPREDAPRFKTWSDASVAPLGLMLSDEEWIDSARKVLEFQRYFVAALDERRQRPCDDLLTALLQARAEGEKPLDTAELLSIVSQVLVAGNETTTNSIAAGMTLLIDHPDQQRLLREEPGRIPTFVEETLRLESAVQGLFRVVKEDTELGGFAIPKGARLMLRYAAANRDGAKFASPHELDVRRTNAGAHLAFGAGTHHCLGAQLARYEMIASFEAILARMDGLAYAGGRNSFRHHPHLCLRGLRELWLTFDRRT
ncbi:MAG: cytochrome P450 [Alphaproteobacteria bacterium]|nr:cytochrome P450 [Alphaproteobacteria bacterium]